MDKNSVYDNTTCFKAHKNKNKSCKNKKCRYWHDLNSNNNNCIINLVDNKENFTLQEVGEVFNITRMRVCQIEKSILEKLKKKISLLF